MAGKELLRQCELASAWMSENLGPHFWSAVAASKRCLAMAQDQVQDGWAWLRPRMWEWWLSARPHFQRLGELIIERCRLAYAWAEQNLPAYYEWAATTAADLGNRAAETINGVVNG